MKNRILIASIAVVLCAGSFAGGYFAAPQKEQITTESESNKYPLLAKRLFDDNPNDVVINFSQLRNDLTDYMKNNGLNGSIYFEYLPTGTSIRVAGDEELVGASLMKIPVVMELYRASELGKIDLDTKIALKQEWLDDKFGTLYKKGAGYELTLRQAAKLALAESDNTAIAMILNSTQSILELDQNVINSLDVSFVRNEQLVLSISARSYSSFLKCLYFSCYLNKADSTEILQHLTESSFNNRLRAAIPKEVQVAHKIGTYSDTTQSDCGIIYEPKRNYVACVMLYVSDDQQGNAHIASISKIMYDYVKKSETAEKK